MRKNTYFRDITPRKEKSMTRFRSAMTLAALAFSLAAVPVVGQDKPEIKVDTKQIETVAKFAKQAQKVADTWYPRIVKTLGADKTKLPKRVTIVLDLEAGGVAGASGNEIRVSARYVAKNPDDLGMIVHELTHVVQAYPKYDPVWLVEGIADYIRFFQYESVSRRPRPNPARASYKDSYRTTGSFLDFVATRYDKELIVKLDKALKAGTYSPELFEQATGKNLDTLNSEWLTSLSAEEDKKERSAR
jgi:hypothetical protein